MATNGMPAAEALRLESLVEYGEGAVVSRTLLKNEGCTLTVFAFDAGEGLSEHSAPFDAYVTILDGSAVLTIGGNEVRAKTGETVLMPADVPHALQAEERFKMFLIMVKEQRQ